MHGVYCFFARVSQSMTPLDYALAGLASVVMGTGFYLMMSWSVPKEANCSFSASIWTDILSFCVAGLIVGMALVSEFGKRRWWFDIVNFLCGMAIIVEHFWQAVANKL